MNKARQVAGPGVKTVRIPAAGSVPGPAPIAAIEGAAGIPRALHHAGLSPRSGLGGAGFVRSAANQLILKALHLGLLDRGFLRFVFHRPTLIYTVRILSGKESGLVAEPLTKVM